MPRKRRILIVDDDISILCAYRQTLEYSTGHFIETAANGEEALQKLSGNKIDLLLLDLMMPRLTGFDVLMQLKTAGKLCPCIITSGYGDGSTLLYALFLGVVDFLTKPVGPEDLLAMVDTVLHRQEKYSRMSLSEIHHLDCDGLISFSLYCIQHRNFHHARLSLNLLNARHDDKSCRILLGMLAEMQKNYPESEKHYLKASCLAA